MKLRRWKREIIFTFSQLKIICLSSTSVTLLSFWVSLVGRLPGRLVGRSGAVILIMRNCQRIKWSPDNDSWHNNPSVDNQQYPRCEPRPPSATFNLKLLHIYASVGHLIVVFRSVALQLLLFHCCCSYIIISARQVVPLLLVWTSFWSWPCKYLYGSVQLCWLQKTERTSTEMENSSTKVKRLLFYPTQLQQFFVHWEVG